MPSAAVLFVAVFVVVGPSDLGLCLKGASHYIAVQYDEGSDALLDKVHWDLPQDHPDGCHALAISPEERNAASISVEEFLRAQAEDAFCRFAAETFGTPNSKFDINRYGFLVKNYPLDGTLQRMVPARLRP